jgi:hypothetical protein
MRKTIQSRIGAILAAQSLALAAFTAAGATYQSTVLGDNPLAYYPLNLNVDTSGTATDLSGNGNTGTYVNISPGGNNVAGPSAYITNAISFDGASTWVDLSGGTNTAILDFTGPITMEAWVQPADSTTFGDIIAKGYDGGTYQEIVVRVNGPYGANYYATSGSAGVSGAQQKTEWTHVVLANDAATTKLYVNGALIQSTADTVGSISFGDPWAIGTGTSAGFSRYFRGNITHVALYNHGLSSDQVLNHYYMGLAGASPSNAAPIITTQPQPKACYVGGTVTFSLGVASVLPVTYQWYKGPTLMPGKTNATLKLLNAQASDVANYSVTVHNSNGTTPSAAAGFTLLNPGAPLRWSESNNSGVWDTASSANWINQTNGQQVVFNTSDQVRFDDTAGCPPYVTLNSSVSPSLVTVAASANEYSFNGTGPLTGSGSLVKSGSTALTLNVPGGFTGSATITGGSVKTANATSLASASAVVVTNDATLDFMGHPFGDGKPVTVSGAGNGGNGALYNGGDGLGGGDIYGNSMVLNVTLAGDTTFGGSQRWDLGVGSTISGPHNLTLLRSATGSYGEWDTVSIGADVNQIELIGGNMGLKNMDTSFANPATMFIVGTNCEVTFWNGGWNGSMHVRSTGRVNLWTAPAAFSGSNLILEDDSRWYAWSGSSPQTYSFAVTLNGVAHLLIGDCNRIYTGVLSGSGGMLIENWNHQMVLSADNTYTGPTIIANGPIVGLTGNGAISHSSLIFFGGNSGSSTHVDATARNDQTLTLASGQTLAGIGAVSGKLTVAAGATLSPAGTNTTIGITTGSNPVGTISATDNITLAGTTVIKLDGSGTNDLVQSGVTLTYGGTLNLVNISGAPMNAGDTFTIFSAGSIAGSFASITPATPGNGLVWDTTQLGSGVIRVASAGQPQPVINHVVVSGGNLIFSGTNGTPGNTYYVLTSTNVAAPVSGWTPSWTNTFDINGAFRVTNAINPSVPREFFLLKLQ